MIIYPIILSVFSQKSSFSCIFKSYVSTHRSYAHKLEKSLPEGKKDCGKKVFLQVKNSAKKESQNKV